MVADAAPVVLVEALLETAGFAVGAAAVVPGTDPSPPTLRDGLTFFELFPVFELLELAVAAWTRLLLERLETSLFVFYVNEKIIKTIRIQRDANLPEHL